MHDGGGSAILEKFEQKPCGNENFDEKWRMTVATVVAGNDPFLMKNRNRK